ncbi:hypothetical protein [Hylemonella gracilis]|nr:hypothetical protein [Hylemonella gracilis]
MPLNRFFPLRSAHVPEWLNLALIRWPGQAPAELEVGRQDNVNHD